MDRPEFDRWLARYAILFPETTEWFSRVEAKSGNPEAVKLMLEGWFEHGFKTLDIRDVLAVTELMLSGDPNYPPLGIMFGDRERTPIHFRQLATRLQSERLAREEKRRQARDQEEYRKSRDAGACRYKYGMGELFRAYVAMLKAGDPDAKRKMHAMADELPGPGERGHKPAEGYSELFSR